MYDYFVTFKRRENRIISILPFSYPPDTIWLSLSDKYTTSAIDKYTTSAI